MMFTLIFLFLLAAWAGFAAGFLACDRLKDRRAERAEARILAMRNTIKSVLTENAHLADGEVCTLIELKQLVPEWQEEFNRSFEK